METIGSIQNEDTEWELYLGMLYSYIMKRTCTSIPRIVVELAPGYRSKIAYALKELDFTGTLFVIDEDVNVCSYIKTRYKEILSRAEIITIPKPFKMGICDLPKNIDLFLSNHCLDDMMISTYTREGVNSFSSDSLKDVWKNLSTAQTEQVTIIKEVFNTFKLFFSTCNVSMVIMAQYDSNVFHANNNYVSAITNKCLQQLKSIFTLEQNIMLSCYHPFGNNEDYLLPDLIANVQNTDKWVIGKPL